MIRETMQQLTTEAVFQRNHLCAQTLNHASNLGRAAIATTRLAENVTIHVLGMISS